VLELQYADDTAFQAVQLKVCSGMSAVSVRLTSVQALSLT